jgi:pimeloyl-ACP methyl ester carboxylesterase
MVGHPASAEVTACRSAHGHAIETTRRRCGIDSIAIGEEGTMTAAHDLPRKIIHKQLTLAAERGQPAAAVPDLKLALKEAEAAEIVELDLGDGLSVFTSGDALAAQTEPAPQRDGQTGLRLKRESDDDTADRGGAIDLSVKALKLVDIDLGAWLGIEAIENAAAERIAEAVARKIDNRDVAGRSSGVGLYRCDARSAYAEPIGPNNTIDAGDAPSLLLLHGFISNTAGSFGGFWSREGRATFAALQRIYGDRIYCFDHATIGKHPTQNAQELARQLGENSALHVLAYSRGGLIGELLSRTQASAQAATQRAEWQHGDALRRAMFEDAGNLDALVGQLNRQAVRVERFVRVASPVRGTWLASDRLDRWLSNLLNVVRLAIPAGPDAIAELLFGLIAAVIKKRLDRRLLPGIEAMNPAGALMALLNDDPPELSKQRLTVIAGDCVASGVFNRLKLLVADGFFGEPHDLVVPTASMFGGAKRTEGLRYFFHQTQKVDHFSYFENPETLARIQTGLIGEAKDYEKLQIWDPARRDQRPVANRAVRPDAPLNVVLPGIMGTVLKRGRDDKLWVDFSDVAFGNFNALEVGGAAQTAPYPPDGAASVHPGAPMDYFPVNTYGALIDYFRNRGELVLPAGYDWRKPIETAADALASKLREHWPTGSPRPLRLIAHSMGGLVARLLFKRHPDLRERFVQSKHNRLLMLGTPNQGSLAVAKTLLGDNGLIGLLDCIAPQNRKQLLSTTATFPGFLEMLPQKDGRAWDSALTWKALYDLKKLPEGKRPTLDPTALALAATGRKMLAEAQSSLPAGQVLYVAGCVPETGKGATIVGIAPNGDYILGPGDGTVPHTAAQVDGLDLPMYYADAKHGDLPDHKKAFEAYRELLEFGDTRRLPRTPEGLRKSGKRGLDLNERTLETLPYRPDRGDIYRALLGMSPRALLDEVAPAAGEAIRLQVVHGGLRFARHTLMVGHYQGDVMSGSERDVDRMFGGKLRSALQLGVYPSAIESFEVFERPLRDHDKRSPFAVVVGLGKPGDLSVGLLRSSIRRGILGWFGTAMPTAAHADDRSNGDGENIGFSIVLLGTTVSGMSVSECVRAILHGVLDAQRTLRAVSAANGSTRAIGDIELIEIYEDKALELHHELKRVLKSPDFKDRFDPPRSFESRSDALRRLRDASRRQQNVRRLDIRCAADGKLRFSLPGPQAVVPEFRRGVDLLEIDDYGLSARLASESAQQIGRVLFNQLLPHPLKRFALEQYDLLLSVDRRAASIPWELADSGDEKPLSVQSGMIRQLRRSDYAPRERVLSEYALVIGDPATEGVTPLVGARKEAAAVAAALEALGYRVTYLERASAFEIRHALGLKPYRIVHFAGHGVVDDRSPLEADACKPRSGMVIGSRWVDDPVQAAPGAAATASAAANRSSIERALSNEIRPGKRLHLLLLTPEDVRESSLQTPELVFINCCHLGHMGKATEHAPALASNLATSFMDNGCRAVVAAGWAVADDAATTFAESFYRALIDGRAEFVEAVREARETTYEAHGSSSNTWGAYQCYGDPRYTIATAELPREAPTFVNAAELESWLRERAVAAMGLGADETQTLRHEIESAVAALRSSGNGQRAWLDESEVFDAHLQCLEKTGGYEAAIGLIDRRKRYRLPIREAIMETETRLRLRLAMHKAAIDAADAGGDIAAAKQAIVALEKACGLVASSQKAELYLKDMPSRDALMGLGTLLRRVFILDRGNSEAQLKALRKICFCMQEAYDLSFGIARMEWSESRPKTGDGHSEDTDTDETAIEDERAIEEISESLDGEVSQKQLGAKIIARALAERIEPPAEERVGIERLIAQCARKVEQRTVSRQFWGDVDTADLMVLLLAANLEIDHARWRTERSADAYRSKAAEIARSYATAISYSATASQVDSIAAYVRFWAEFAGFMLRRLPEEDEKRPHWAWFASAFEIDPGKPFLAELERLGQQDRAAAEAHQDPPLAAARRRPRARKNAPPPSN